MEKNKAAFFDIDGTLFRNSLLIEHYFLMTEDDILDKKNWLENVKPLYQKYQDRKGSYEDYLDKASLFLSLIHISEPTRLHKVSRMPSSA